MELDQVPAAMVEAVGRVLASADGWSGDEVWTDEVFGWERGKYTKIARDALAAALSVCDARVERRLCWPSPSGLPEDDLVGAWLMGAPVGYAGAQIESRLILTLPTTPAEPVPDNGGEK